ncbi:MAG: glucose-1-phosphate adenylyltransferase, partial [Pseudomonadota bacterium]
LIRHLSRGWSNFRSELDEFIEVLPASQRTGDDWYVGTADAIYQNLDIIHRMAPEYVLVLSGDHVYRMDYGPLIAQHQRARADMTVCCIEVPLDDARAFGVMSVDEDNWITGFEEKPASPACVPGKPDTALASMGNYVFSTQFLFEVLFDDADDTNSSRDFGKDIIPKLIGKKRIQAVPFRNRKGEPAYWRDVGTLDAFWRSNLELAEIEPKLDLYDRSWPLLTHQEQLPPAKFVLDSDEGRGTAIDSMVSGGCVISGGQVRNSVLFSNVRVDKGAVVDHTVVLPDVRVGQGVRLRNAIIDRGCHLPDGLVIGESPEDDRARFRVTEDGIVLVTGDMLGQAVHFRRN